VAKSALKAWGKAQGARPLFVSVFSTCGSQPPKRHFVIAVDTDRQMTQLQPLIERDGPAVLSEAGLPAQEVEIASFEVASDETVTREWDGRWQDFFR